MICTAGIFENKKNHTEGDLVTGWIALQVSGVFAVENIVLTIDKESEIKIEELEENTLLEEKAIRHLGKFVIYAEKGKKVFPGLHKFPFSFRMMSGEGATVNYRTKIGKKKIFILNRYISKCEVRIYGIFKPVSKAIKEINIVEAAEYKIERKTYRKESIGCFCFDKSSIDVSLEIDSILYAGNQHYVSITPSTGSVSKVNAELWMSIETFYGSMVKTEVSVPFKIVKKENEYVLEIEEVLPSETARNDFFSISYTISFFISISGKSPVTITKPVSILGKKVRGGYTPPVIEESALYPEKYLSLES